MVMPESRKEHVLFENKSEDREGLWDSPVREKSLQDRVLASRTCMVLIALGITVGMTACKLKHESLFKYDWSSPGVIICGVLWNISS